MLTTHALDIADLKAEIAAQIVAQLGFDPEDPARPH